MKMLAPKKVVSAFVVTCRCRLRKRDKFKMTIIALTSLLLVHGCSLPGAAAITANLQAESGLNPSLSNGAQIGLAQWQGPRRRRLLQRAGNRWREAEQQIAFIATELREFHLWDRVCNSRNPELAARVFMLKYERPRAVNPGYRMRLALEIYREMGR